MKSTDPSAEQIQKGVDDLTKASHKLAEQVYKAQSEKQQGPSQAEAQPNPDAASQQTSSDKPKDDNVVDAEYKEEDNK